MFETDLFVTHQSKLNLGWFNRAKLGLMFIGIGLIISLANLAWYFWLINQAEVEPLVYRASAFEASDSARLRNLELIWVDIGGAVKKPGVYRLSVGSRLVELIDQAGGFSGLE